MVVSKGMRTNNPHCLKSRISRNKTIGITTKQMRYQDLAIVYLAEIRGSVEMILVKMIQKKWIIRMTKTG